MNRTVFLCSLALICSLLAENVAFGQSAAVKTCPFNIIGMWKIEGRTETDSLFYSFSPEGWVRVMSHSADALPREYEVIAEVKYALDKPSAPKRIEFITQRGNDAFPPGKTSLQVVDFGDESFITVDSKTQAQIRWIRTQTHRYFITFAGRGGPATSAFAMWTTLDGREIKIEALGVGTESQSGEGRIFGTIPNRLYHEFEFESNKDSDVMFRLELNEAEFERSHKVFETWSEFARLAKLPSNDPYLNVLEFLKSAAENLNQCDEKLKLDKIATAAPNSPQQTLEYIRMMRKKNKDLHVTNGMFPEDWRPAPLPITN